MRGLECKLAEEIDPVVVCEDSARDRAFFRREHPVAEIWVDFLVLHGFRAIGQDSVCGEASLELDYYAWN